MGTSHQQTGAFVKVCQSASGPPQFSSRRVKRKLGKIRQVFPDDPGPNRHFPAIALQFQPGELRRF
ncbi:hypothetical protein LOC69_12410 [Blastopirellula sp. JC733]|nr:hypothetical protein [Blastopirellula sediminis]